MRWLTLLACGILLAACSTGSEPDDDDEDSGEIPAVDMEYVVFAWNDLGMHCLNPTYDQAVILPPYNTVWAQVIRRGSPPEIVTAGLSVEYRMIDNTFSYGKTDSYGGEYAQFWDNSQALFGVDLEHDKGLNLVDPGISNGLSGTMVPVGNHFQVDGIPVVPVDDAGTWDPYQVIEVTVKSNGAIVGQTRATVPTSDEINCERCHDAADPFRDILLEHDEEAGTNLAASTPVLCADGACHTSPALGQSGDGNNGYLSEVIHGAHAGREAECYDCHPGAVTQCNRSLSHTGSGGGCTDCHGTMQQVASSIASGNRIPWIDEPSCAGCHAGVQEVGSDATLYRNTTGHHGVYCPACHNSPHAMYPSREDTDSYQPVQYQGVAITIGSCAVCHSSSRGEGSDEFGEQHGGSGEDPTACNVCHTAVPTNTSRWPHGFTWADR